MMTKVERNNLIKEMYEKGLLEQLYKEVIAEECTKIKAGNLSLKQKIEIQDEYGKETWSVFAYMNGGVAILLDKEYSIENECFGYDNNYRNSNVRQISKTCNPVKRIRKVLGVDSFIPLEIDLFSLDGLRDYGVCEGDLSGVMTFDMYRNNRENIDYSKMLLSTPDSTPSGTGASYVQFVRSDGRVCFDYSGWDGFGVRPFCFLKSSIFVSLVVE